MSQILELPKKDFPPLLIEIPDAPKKLYYVGELPNWQNNKFLAVVGSRKYSQYGKDACQKLIEGLRGYPIIIVSGLALGIDSIAHESALRAGLKTIAIPGSGLNRDVIYPASHLGLADRIVKSGGLLLSEFEPNLKAAPYTFPQRNRIMAGMSHATLVIEAEEISGTLITSKLATEYNRDVLTIPHSIFSNTGAGPHMLLRLGATLIRKSEDILEALHLETVNNLQLTNDIPENCSPEEIKILEMLAEPVEKETLITKLGLPISEINTLLSMMEIKGLIKETLGEVHRT
ncbi:MAG: DNA-processing protein DprA [bacterium]|nr:DNA-processing protein DprA [bacterium]